MDEHKHRWFYDPILNTYPEQINRTCVYCKHKESRSGHSYITTDGQLMFITIAGNSWRKV